MAFRNNFNGETVIQEADNNNKENLIPSKNKKITENLGKSTAKKSADLQVQSFFKKDVIFEECKQKFLEAEKHFKATRHKTKILKK